MRNPQKQGTKGSLKWIQILINDCPDLINQRLGRETIQWFSPLKKDQYAEYRDSDFLSLLGLGHLQQLKDFWPRSGPQWDALGKSDDKYFLVEAKANIPEIVSSCAAKSPRSLSMINNAINDTRVTLGISTGSGWTEGFYQYANRLAHLYFLRNICNVNTELVFIYFCNDSTHIPTSVDEWKAALESQKKHMGLTKTKNVSEVFIDCKDLQ